MSAEVVVDDACDPRAKARVASGAPADLARVFGALGLVFLSDPTEESLRALAECAGPPLDASWGKPLGDLARAAAETDLLAARVEYTRLLYGPRGAPCPPWECVTRDAAPALMGPRHRHVLEAFRRLGVEPTGIAGESADHIGLELTFLSMLATRLADGEDCGDELERFWHEHVETWMPDYARRIVDAARLELFAAAGRLLRSVTKRRETGLPTNLSAAEDEPEHESGGESTD